MIHGNEWGEMQSKILDGETLMWMIKEEEKKRVEVEERVEVLEREGGQAQMQERPGVYKIHPRGKNS